MDTLSKMVRVFLLIALVLFFLTYGASVLLPLAVALLLWFFINALSDAYRRVATPVFQMPPLLALLLASATILAASLIVIDLVVANVAAMGQQRANVDAALTVLTQKAAQLLGVESQEVVDHVLAFIQLDPLVSNIVAGMASLASQFTVVFLYVVFLLIEQRYFDLKLRAIVPNEEKRARLQAILQRIAEDVQGYLWIMTIVSALTAVLSYGVMVLVGLEQAFFWAFLIFILNFIPTIGSIIGTALPALYALLQFQRLAPFLTVLIAVGAIQFVVGNMIQPRLAARRLNLSQFVVVLSLFAWGAIWGVVGMFLAVPITAIMMLVLANFESTRPIAMIMSESGSIDPPDRQSGKAKPH
ncbi:hypothetical protein AUC68_10215 [Methyloceanibacter methanicus]|uniref:Permease n=1 Tax=Methyloceanibacter methanicus TaxID=1774968 RepID=A0A1E3VWJ0_9HYPH|nr:AI-2E family transporter [Methyloceanibacter methanicus]ODR97900.1 hypothetical protein AUC68_10215 [Methyloceanibacter methanicus]